MLGKVANTLLAAASLGDRQYSAKLFMRAYAVPEGYGEPYKGPDLSCSLTALPSA